MTSILSPQNSTNGRIQKSRLSLLGPAYRAFPGLSARLLTGPFLSPRGRMPALDPTGARETFVVQAADARTSIYLYGTGPLTVLVHGWAGGATQLEPLRNRLVEAGQSVALFDAPGHGGSLGRTTNAGEIAHLVEAIARRCTPVHAIVGHSLGGLAAALANARSVRASGLILLAPLPSFEFALDQYQFMIGFPDAVREVIARRVERLAGTTRSQAQLAAALSPKTKTLLIHDASDRSIPVAHSRRLARDYGEVTYLETEGLGHKRLLQDPAVLDEVAQFVTSL